MLLTIFTPKAMLSWQDVTELNMVVEFLFSDWRLYLMKLTLLIYPIHRKLRWLLFLFMAFLLFVVIASHLYWYHITNLLRNFQDVHCSLSSVICGDLNLHETSWLHSPHTSSAGTVTLDFCGSHNWLISQLIMTLFWI